MEYRVRSLRTNYGWTYDTAEEAREIANRWNEAEGDTHYVAEQTEANWEPIPDPPKLVEVRLDDLEALFDAWVESKPNLSEDGTVYERLRKVRDAAK